MEPYVKTLTERLASKLSIGTLSGCWFWTGGVNKGYGQLKVKINGIWVQYGAHRASYELANGLLPPNHEIDHDCCNPACCNPAHMFVVTHSENMRRIWKRGRGKNGARAGTANPDAAFTRSQVNAVIADPRGSTTVARAYGVSKATVQRARHGQTYREDGVIVVAHPNH